MNKTTLRSAAIGTLALITAFAAADPVQVTVNGTPVNFDAAQPQMVNGRVLVPLRGVFEQMGANVDWNASSQSVMADGNGRHIRLKIGTQDASVNGHVVTMDVPPEIVNGSTMVPLRFLSESLGAKVDWQPENNLVAIVTVPRGDGAAQRFNRGGDNRSLDNRRNDNPPQPPVIVQPPQTVIIEDRRQPVRPAPPAVPPPYVFTRDTAIPIQLDEQLNSGTNRAGDSFTATVRSDSGRYMDFPDGTIIEGRVRNATPASGSHAGTLDIRFTHIRFPDGARYPIGGFVTRLNDPNIVRTDNGRFVAKDSSTNNTARDAEIGAGAGLVLGSLKGKAVGGAVVGGALGAIVGAFDHHLAHNVIFDQGTRFALVLNRNLTIDRHDLNGGR